MNIVAVSNQRVRMNMWRRHRKIPFCLSLLGVVPVTDSFVPATQSQLATITTPLGSPSLNVRSIPSAFAVREEYVTSMRQKDLATTIQLRMTSSFFPENAASWDEPELNESTLDGGGGGGDLEDEDESPSLAEHQAWTKALEKTIGALEKKRRSLQSEYEKAQGVEDTVARAQLLVSNLYHFTPGVKTATVQDWENDGAEVELTLNPKYSTANEEADALFAQARKLKRGSQVVKELLEESEVAFDLLCDARSDLESVCVDDEVDQGRFALIQDRLKRSERTTKFQAPSLEAPTGSKSNSRANRRPSKPEIGSPQSNIRKLMSPGGCIVLVGRNRRGNEHLSLAIARGNDIWMHSRGCPGE